MDFTKKELGFILYNNRSKNVVENFIPKNLNKFRIIQIESLLEKSKRSFLNDKKMVEVPIKDLNLNEKDIIINKSDLSNLTNKFIENKNKFNKIENDFLKKRNIPEKVIKKWKLLGLSNFKNKELEIIGATVHPILSNILIDGIEGGGIVFPLFENNELKNCAIRKISLSNSNMASLKYSLACPDIPVWKSDNISPGDEIWLTEGLFDMFALDNIGLKCVSCSSAMWSSIQLHEIIMMRPSKINIFSDNDKVGLRIGSILNDFFKSYGIFSEVYKSINCKDASEHFFESELSLKDLEKINDFNKYIELEDSSFDFLKHLKNRNY